MIRKTYFKIKYPVIFSKLISGFNQNDNGSFRLKRIILTAISTFGSKGVSMLVSIISLPLTINYLGSERFGMMETMVSLIFLMNFADLGLGFGLQNRIAEMQEDSNNQQLHKAVSSVFFTLFFTSIVFTLLFVLIFPNIDWFQLFNVHSNLARQEASTSVILFFSCFIIQIPFSIVQKLQNGFQEGYVFEFWRTLGNISGLVFLIIVVKSDLGIPYIILAIYGSNTVFIVINFIYYFYNKRRNLFPKFSYFETAVFLKLYKDGLIFFCLQIATIILISSDRLIITQFLGPTSVATYSIGYRLAIIFSTPVDAFVLPLLPAFNDAMIKKDVVWIKKILSKGFNLILMISSLLGLTLIFFGNLIIKFWVGVNSNLAINILCAFGAYILFSNLNSMFSYIMLTPKFINKILPAYLFSVIVALLMKFVLVEPLGISGIIWATIIPMSIIFFSFSYTKLRKSEFI